MSQYLAVIAIILLASFGCSPLLGLVDRANTAERLAEAHEHAIEFACQAAASNARTAQDVEIVAGLCDKALDDYERFLEDYAALTRAIEADADPEVIERLLVIVELDEITLVRDVQALIPYVGHAS
jgi:hypothetical protein